MQMTPQDYLNLFYAGFIGVIIGVAIGGLRK